jgi:hypothetical protein
MKCLYSFGMMGNVLIVALWHLVWECVAMPGEACAGYGVWSTFSMGASPQQGYDMLWEYASHILW